MRKKVLFLICMIAIQVFGQEEKLNLSFDVGSPLGIDLKDICDITFVEDTEPLDISGSEWFYKSAIGNMEWYYFHNDGTIEGHLYQKDSHKEANTQFGTYSLEDYVIKIRTDAISQDWHVVRHSKDMFTLLSTRETDMYKVQQTYYITTKDNSISIGNEGDIITWVDEEMITMIDNKIKPLKGGVGFALVKDAMTNRTLAYKVVVSSPNITIIDWTSYFDKSVDEINVEFGNPDNISIDDFTKRIHYSYKNYCPEILNLYFTFNEESRKVFFISPHFSSYSYLETYENYIKDHYFFYEDESTNEEKMYYDTDNRGTASISIKVISSTNYGVYQICYTKLK